MFVDLRSLPALRAVGETERADDIQGWVEAQSAANDLQFSELHEADTGRYAGSIPMVGFGPGAYLIALDDSVADAACGEYGDRGEMPPVDAGMDPDAGAAVDAGVDAGGAAPDAGGAPDASVDVDAGAPRPDAGFCFGDCPESGCGCRSLEGSDAAGGFWLILIAALGRRRR